MKKLILLVLLAAIGIGGYLFYRSVRSGPKYSLMQAAKATQTHDMAEFERYVDVNSVTGSLVDQVAAQGADLGLPNFGGFALGGALQLLKPQLARAAHREIQAYVERGAAGAAQQAQRQGPMPVSVLGLASKVVSADSRFRNVKYVTEQGEQALVGLEFTEPKYDTTLVVELKMLNRGDHWQVTEITNTGELLRQTTRLEAKRRRSSE